MDIPVNETKVRTNHIPLWVVALIIILLFAVAVSAGFAYYFHLLSIGDDMSGKIAPSKKTERSGTLLDEELESQLTCFAHYDLEFESIDEGWADYKNNDGFSLKYPPDYSVEENFYDNRGKYEPVHVISDTVGNSADIRLIPIDRSIYIAPGLYSPTTIYEPHSMTWWSGYRVRESCDPTASFETLNAVSVYIVEDGDAGSSWRRYILILNPTNEQRMSYDAWVPLVLEIRTFGTSFDDDGVMSEGEVFLKHLNSIIKTIEIQKPIKG